MKTLYFSLNSNYLRFYIEEIIVVWVTILKDVTISIPQKYLEFLENEKEKSKKIQLKKKSKSLDELKNKNIIKDYYKIFLENIQKTDIANLISLLKKYYIKIKIDLFDILNKLKNIISFLDTITKIYDLKEGNDSEEESNSIILCPICFDHHSDCHVSPCGHSFCINCIQKYKYDLCPLCRKKLDGVLEFPTFEFKNNNN